MGSDLNPADAHPSAQLNPQNTKNIWAVGRNYAEHAKELNNPIPQRPLIFLKAGSCITTGDHFSLPKNLGDIHFECELAVQIDKKGEPLRFGLALDLTARAVQAAAKKKGEPWTQSKSFKGACPLGPLIDFQSFELFSQLRFEFFVNNQLAQQGRVSEMIFSLPVLLEHLRQYYPLADGDIVLTGTPAGVGPLLPGDQLKAQIKSTAGATPGTPYELTWDVN